MIILGGRANASNVSYVYDSLGRLVTVYDPSNNAAVYKYDAVGNLLSITNYSSSQFNALELGSNSGMPGSTITIYGTDFCSNPTVTFNGTSATVVSSTATQIVVTVPSGASTGSVVITCGSSQVNAGSFTVATNAPSIAGFTPGTGGAGTSVTITGTNFATDSADDTVGFNDSRAVVTAATATSLTANVPANATSGPITVGTAYGQAVTSANFIVPPPGPALGYTGEASLGTAVTVSLNTANQQALLLFNGMAGQQVSVVLSRSTFSTSSTVKLYDPYGNVLVTQGYSGSSGFVDSQTLPTTGTYSLTISPGNSTGSVTVTIYNAPTRTGSITIGGGTVTVASTVPGQDTKLAFSGTAGQQISLAMSNNSISPGYPSVYIYNPDGSLLADAQVAGSGAFIDVQTLAQTGTYTILVDVGQGTGNLTLQLYNAPTQTGTISIGGSPVTATSTVPGQDTKLTFSGTAGQQISLAMSNNSISPGYPSVYIYNPDGSLLADAQVAGSGAFIDVQTLAQTGTYTILVDVGQGTGSLTLQLYNAPTQTGTISIGGSPVTVTSAVPGQDTKLTFSGTAGQQISLAMSSNTISPGYPVVCIYNPDGSLLTNAQVAGSGAFIDVQTLAQTGTYTILVDVGQGTGSLTLQLYNAPTQTGTISVGGSPVTVTSAVPGQDTKLTFSGTAGQQISLAANNNSISPGYPTVYIYNPDGSLLTNTAVVGSGAFIDVQTLAQTGTYTILVDVGQGTGSLTLQLYNAPTQTGTISIGGSPVTVTSTVPGQDTKLTFSGTSGQQISLAMSNNSISPGSPTVYIYNPDGSLLTNTAVVGSGAFIDVQTLAQTGTYTILIDVGQGTGSLSLQLYNAPTQTGTISIGGSPVTVASTVPGQDTKLTFSGTAGQAIKLAMSNNTMSPGNPVVYIYNPNGSVLTNTAVPSSGATINVSSLPSTGTYTILVDVGAATGNMTLTLSQ